jgi:Domain of unknown function (DUF4082)
MAVIEDQQRTGTWRWQKMDDGTWEPMSTPHVARASAEQASGDGDGNGGDYLPLTGGTVTGDLEVIAPESVEMEAPAVSLTSRLPDTPSGWNYAWTGVGGIADELGANLAFTGQGYSMPEDEFHSFQVSGYLGVNGAEMFISADELHITGVVDPAAPTDAANKAYVDAASGGAGGSTILTGTAAPAAGTGAVGDYYLDTDDRILYGPKVTGGTSWGSAQSVYGAQTPAGTNPLGPYALSHDVLIAKAGRVTGLRFWRGSPNSYTSHTMRLWSSGGVQLGNCATAGETGTGWKSASFASAVAVTAGQTVRIVIETVAASSDNIGITDPQGSDIVNGDLTLYSSVAKYGTVGAYPTTTAGSRYWIDLIYEASSTIDPWPVALKSVPPGGAAGQVITPDATAPGGVKWVDQWETRTLLADLPASGNWLGRKIRVTSGLGLQVMVWNGTAWVVGPESRTGWLLCVAWDAGGVFSKGSLPAGWKPRSGVAGSIQVQRTEYQCRNRVLQIACAVNSTNDAMWVPTTGFAVENNVVGYPIPAFTAANASKHLAITAGLIRASAQTPVADDYTPGFEIPYMTTAAWPTVAP